MAAILEVLTQNILPIFLVAGLGYWLRRYKGFEPRPLAGIVFNAFSPALVFVSLVKSELPAAELVDLALYALAVILVMGVIALLLARLLRLSRAATAVMLLTVMFVNGGNYGLTLNQIRLGESGLARAIVYYVVSTMLIYTLGVFIITLGNTPWRAALRRLARVPAVYAVVLALLVYSFEIPIPTPVMRGLDVAADGAIPAMLVVLGMNIGDMSSLGGIRAALPAVSLRLVVGPLVAVALAAWMGLQGLSRSASVIEASMPAAVLTTVLATEFDVYPELVTSIVVISTLLSPLTLSLFITIFAL